MGVMTTPGEIVLKRRLSAAYSIAKARLTAGMVPLVRLVITAALGWSTSEVEMLTTCPERCRSDGNDGGLLADVAFDTDQVGTVCEILAPADGARGDGDVVAALHRVWATPRPMPLEAPVTMAAGAW